MRLLIYYILTLSSVSLLVFSLIGFIEVPKEEILWEPSADNPYEGHYVTKTIQSHPYAIIGLQIAFVGGMLLLLNLLFLFHKIKKMQEYK